MGRSFVLLPAPFSDFRRAVRAGRPIREAGRRSYVLPHVRIACLSERPQRTLLRRVAPFGLPVAVLGALPVTVAAIGAWSPDPATAFAAAALHNVTGIAGGVAYAAVIALVAERIGDRRGPVTTALAACGQRSMTYLAQSVVWLVATEPLLLDVRGGVGVAVWLVTVAGAEALRRAGRRGPAEVLLRRLTYRTPMTA